MNTQIIKQALLLAEDYINDGSALPENPDDPYYVLSTALYEAIKTLNVDTENWIPVEG